MCCAAQSKLNACNFEFPCGAAHFAALLSAGLQLPIFPTEPTSAIAHALLTPLYHEQLARFRTDARFSSAVGPTPSLATTLHSLTNSANPGDPAPKPPDAHLNSNLSAAARSANGAAAAAGSKPGSAALPFGSMSVPAAGSGGDRDTHAVVGSNPDDTPESPRSPAQYSTTASMSLSRPPSPPISEGTVGDRDRYRDRDASSKDVFQAPGQTDFSFGGSHAVNAGQLPPSQVGQHFGQAPDAMPDAQVRPSCH